MKFAKGNPGGPGRPKGSRNAGAAYLVKKLSENKEEVFEAIMRGVRSGDAALVALAANKLAPNCRDVPLTLADSNIVLEHEDDAKKALSDVIKAVFRGEMTLSDALTLSKLITDFASLFTKDDTITRYRKQVREVLDAAEQRELEAANREETGPH